MHRPTPTSRMPARISKDHGPQHRCRDTPPQLGVNTQLGISPGQRPIPSSAWRQGRQRLALLADAVPRVKNVPYIDEDDQLRVENNRPFEMLLDPQINANALTWAQDSNKARTETIDDGKGSSLCVGWRRRDSNPQPRPCKGLALPVAPRPRSVSHALPRRGTPTILS